MPVYSTIPNMELTGSKTDIQVPLDLLVSCNRGQVCDITATYLEWPLAELDRPQ